MPNDFLFADESEVDEGPDNSGNWKILVVDDEPEVHAVTKLALSDFSFQGKRLEFISAYSGEEAKKLILEHDDAAIVLLDVVMETDDAGLQVARFIREEADNTKVRIILRTGQPGQAPEREVIVNYDINDYKSKTELTAQKLFTVVMASLRSYRDILSLETSRHGLEKIITASADIFGAHSMDTFIDGVMQQLTSIIGCDNEALYIVNTLVASESLNARTKGDSKLIILAGQGEFANHEGQLVEDVVDGKLMHAIQEALDNQTIVYRDDFLVAYCSSRHNKGSLLYISGLPNPVCGSHRRLVELFSQNVQIAYENVQLTNEIEDTQQELVHRLSEAVEQRSVETGNHVKRVAEICYLFARYYGLSQSEAERLKMAAPLHDVGKLGIPDKILNKPDKLDDDEWEIMKTHSDMGYQILKNSQRSIIVAGAMIARDHHERWDGSGYPVGKRGTDIHIFGRIASIADAYDALRHRRVYKEPWDVQKTVEYLVSEKGKRFEPKLVDIFCEHLDEFEMILTQSPD